MLCLSILYLMFPMLQNVENLTERRMLQMSKLSKLTCSLNIKVKNIHGKNHKITVAIKYYKLGIGKNK